MKKDKRLKDFHAVEFMRKRRDELSKLYKDNPNEFLGRLDNTCEKYKNLFHQKQKRAA